MNSDTSFEKVLISLTVVFLFIITYNKVINIISIQTFETSDTTALSFDKLSNKSDEIDTLTLETNQTSKIETKEKSADKTAFVQTSKTVLFPINLNTATTSELSQIKGIGEVLANRIVDFRIQHGNFKSLEELMLVKGIGENTFLKIKPYICLK